MGQPRSHAANELRHGAVLEQRDGLRDNVESDGVVVRDRMEFPPTANALPKAALSLGSDVDHRPAISNRVTPGFGEAAANSEREVECEEGFAGARLAVKDAERFPGRAGPSTSGSSSGRSPSSDSEKDRKPRAGRRVALPSRPDLVEN